MGYELSTTALQLALAYATFANGGELLEPALVKEIRAPDGTVRYHHERRVVRRVLTPDVADRMRKMLLNVVENGTALQADLSSFLLAGKTGTPRRTVNGRYAAQQYNPNFVGLFPGDAPQYVIVVKLTNPRGEKGSFYSAATAAPLTKTILQAALAARDVALDRNKLASSAGAAASAHPEGASGVTTGASELALRPVASRDSAWLPSAVDTAMRRGHYVISLAEEAPKALRTESERAVPDVHGMALRDAVRLLHNAGFHVRLIRGARGETAPAPGTFAAVGTLVRLSYDF
jgi:membrane peptidoglycan carboxypeptidase